MPHVGGWREAQIPEMAYRLNVPVLSAKGEGGEKTDAVFACVDQPNIIIEVVKEALDGDGTIIRVYECYGRRSAGVKLNLGFAPTSAEVCNLTEKRTEDAALCGNVITFDMKPYEIKSFRIR